MGEIGKGGNIVRVPITIILIQLCFIKYQIFTPCLESKLCVDCNKNNTVGAITRAETSYPSRAIALNSVVWFLLFMSSNYMSSYLKFRIVLFPMISALMRCSVLLCFNLFYIMFYISIYSPILVSNSFLLSFDGLFNSNIKSVTSGTRTPQFKSGCLWG